MIRARTSIVCVLVLLATSAPARAAGELTRREKGDLAIKARAILKKHCFECHGGPDSRGTIQVLDHSRLVAAGPNPVPFVAPDKAAGSQIIQFLEEGSMPPGDRPRPSNEEIQTLKEWIACTAPSYPAAFDDRTTLNSILNDLQQHAEDAPNLRYFSLAHLIKDDADLPNLKKAEFDLQKALTWCGVKPPAEKLPAEPVDGTATLFRFDVRHAGWDAKGLFYRSPRYGAPDLFPLTPYDLILLEYPHAYSHAGDDPLAKRLDDYFAAAGLARRVPYLRADWVAEHLAIRTPLADDLLSLSKLATSLQAEKMPDLGKEKKMPCGPATRAFAAKNPVPAAPKAESARPVLPLTAWYSGDCQANAPAFTLTVEAIDVGGKTVKEIAPGAPFRLKVTTDRKVNFVLLNVFANRDVEILRTKQGGFLEAGQHCLVPPAEGGKAAGGFKIPGILTGEKQANEYFVLLASTEKITPPTIVRSRHAAGNPDCMDEKRYPIYRFIFDTDAKFDQSMVVRKVIAITVTEKQ